MITTIMMLSMLSLLVLSQMKGLLLYAKLNQDLLRTHEAHYALESVAARVALFNRSSRQGSCFVDSKNLNEIVAKVLNHKSCNWRDGDDTYVYLISYLGEYPCLNIMLGHNAFSSEHWLITVTRQPSSTSRHEILQLRIAKPIQLAACAFVAPRQIKAGIISWRRLFVLT